MLKISVEKRWDDYKAHVTDQPGVWGCGRTQSEAIGECIRTALSLDVGTKDIAILTEGQNKS